MNEGEEGKFPQNNIPEGQNNLFPMLYSQFVQFMLHNPQLYANQQNNNQHQQNLLKENEEEKQQKNEKI